MAQKLQPQPQKLIGFAPDLDPSTPGIFQACNNVVPTQTGFKGAASPVHSGLPTLPSPVVGSALISRLNGTVRQFAGTATSMYEHVDGAWVDMSRPGGYSLGTSSTWRFAAFGNESLAVNGTDVLQAALDGEFTNVPVSVASVSIDTAGTGYTSAPTVTIGPPDLLTGVQATATATTSGSIASTTVTKAGAGYAVAPFVGVQGSNTSAKLTANMNGGVMAVLPASAGAGYTSAPSVSITGGGGTGATATAIIGTTATATSAISGGAILAISLQAGPWSMNQYLGASSSTISGAGYTVVPTITISAPPAGGTQATATAIVVRMPGNTYAVIGVTITNAGAGYASAPTVTFSAPTTLGTVVGFQITNPGSGYNTIPSVELTGGSPTTPATATANVSGSVTGVTISNAGSGFTSNPTLVCSEPQMNPLVLSSNLKGGALAGLIVVYPGTGFTTAPTITFSGGNPTTPATATCTIDSRGFVNSVTLTNAGIGYTSAPTITISTPNTASATATVTATTSQTVTAITITNPGSGYTVDPVVTLTGGGVSSESQATATAKIVQAPVGQVTFVANGQLFVCNCIAPVEVAGGDYWFASGLRDHTNWDYRDEKSLCAYGRLLDTPGPITAGTSLGPNAVLFKSNSLYMGTQTGYPNNWDFQKVSAEIGAPCQEAVVSAGSTLYFIGPDDFYAYQGNGLPVPIGQNVRRWFLNTRNPSYKNKISSFYDQEQRVIYWAFVSNSSLNGDIDTCITYNPTTGTWGRMDTDMQCFVQILNGQLTYDGLGDKWEAWEDLPPISYNSSYWINFRITPGYFDNSNTMFALAGTSKGASITTNAFGDDLFYSSMQQFKMRFYQQPESGSAIWQGRPTLGSGDPSIINHSDTGPFVASDARFDVDRNARWHNLVITFNGDFEMLQWYPLLVKTGRN